MEITVYLLLPLFSSVFAICFYFLTWCSLSWLKGLVNLILTTSPRTFLLRPVEVVHSNKEFTEEDVTDAVQRGGSFTFSSSGLPSDIEAIERNIFGGFSRFFEAAEEMTNGFFDAFAKAPNIFDRDLSSSPSMRKGIPIDEHPRREASPKPKEYEPIDADLSSLAQDV